MMISKQIQEVVREEEQRFDWCSLLCYNLTYGENMKYNSFLNLIKEYFKSFLQKDENTLRQEFVSSIEKDYSDKKLDSFMFDYEIKHKDDTVAYIPKFSSGGSGSLFLSKTYLDQGRYLPEQDYIDLIKEKINREAFSKDNKSFVLFKIWSDAKKINNMLAPLKPMGINYTLDLTGGSVRDFVLDKENDIKDLDFMLSISWHGFNSNELVKKIPAHFSQQELKEVNWAEFLSRVEKKENDEDLFETIYPIDQEELKRKILNLCLNRVNQKYEFFGKKNRSIKVNSNNAYDESLTRNDRLMAVAKLDKNNFNTNYPIDILLTDFIKPTFLEDFDFDICKASICFVNNTIKKEFPKSSAHLVGRFVANIDFWADVKNKKITYNVKGRGLKEIDRSFDNHLVRIKEKYPEFEVLVVGENVASIEYIKKKMFAKKLENDLDNKTANIKKKNKI